MSEPLPYPGCGTMQMAYTGESCRTEEGLTVRRLRRAENEGIVIVAAHPVID
jgi:hypothetical protein